MLLRPPIQLHHRIFIERQCSRRRGISHAAARQCSCSATARAAASKASAVVQPITPQPAPIDRSPGFVCNEAAVTKIPTEWHGLLDAVTAAYQQACGAALVGVYLRGSLPRGCFIPYVSDVDTFALVLAPAVAATTSGSSGSESEGTSSSSSSSDAAGAKLPSQMQQQVKELLAPLLEQHSHLCFVKLEVKVLQVPAGTATAVVLQQHMAAPSSSSSSSLPALTPSMLASVPAAFELKTQSVCLAGVDLPQLLPAAAALRSSLQLLPGLAEDVAAAREEAAAAARAGDAAQQVTIARWCLKRLLRAAFELVQQQAGVYTRDLYWCCHYSSQQLPKLQQQLEQTLELYVQLQNAAADPQQQQRMGQQSKHAWVRDAQELYHEQRQLDAAWQLIDALLPRVEALFLKQMLTEDAGWLTKHVAGHIPGASTSTRSSSSSAAMVQQQVAETLEQQQQQWGWTELQHQMQGLFAAVTGATASRDAVRTSTGTMQAAAAAAAAVTQSAEDPRMLLGAAPPTVQLPMWGSVKEHNWNDQADRAAACSSISAVLLQQTHTRYNKNNNSNSSSRGSSRGSSSGVAAQPPAVTAAGSSVDAQAAAAERLLLLNAEQQPLVLRGVAADWPAVSQQGWGLGWLSQQGFRGKVRLARSLQFPFVEPQLVQYLDQIAGPAAAPSQVVDMGIAEFVARLQPGCSLPPLLYTPHEHYYMQAQLPPHMEQQLLLQDFLQHIEARGCNTSVSAALASSTAAATPPTSSSSAAALEDDDAESCKLFFSQAPRVWVSPAGAVSPLHYDTSHSFLLQMRGFKRMLFVSPEQLYRLYCYPDTHLLRRRSRVNVCTPDLVQHPLFAGVGALEVVLGPGDAVFFPSMWAHYTESLGECVGGAAGMEADGIAGGSSSCGSCGVCGASVSVTFRVAQA